MIRGLIIFIILSANLGFSFSDTNFVTLGDSISSGFNSNRFGDNRLHSWSSGRELEYSVVRSIEDHLGRRVNLYSISTVGARSKDLVMQSKRFHKTKPDIVTILIGGNDLCSHHDEFDTHIVSFKDNLKASLDNLLKANPNIKIIITTLPDVSVLFKLANSKKSCMKKWKYMNICQKVLSEENIGSEQSIFLDHAEQINQAIAENVEELNNKNIYFIKDLYNHPAKISEMSDFDCFHPNSKGQNSIGAYVTRTLKTMGFYDELN
jgi:lysophospholipase L1-like esterase